MTNSTSLLLPASSDNLVKMWTFKDWQLACRAGFKGQNCEDGDESREVSSVR